MISKLRKKIIAINVISVCVVFFVAEVLMFAIGFNRIDNERKNRIVSAFEFDYATENFDDKVMLKDIALVVYDTSSSSVVYQKIGEKSKLTQDKLDENIQRIISAKSESGWISFWRIRYNKKADDTLIKIVISNSYLRGQESMSYVLFSCGTLLIGVACYLVISWMLARFALAPVEESWAKQRQFVADASHELKTPLSVIMANTEIIASHQEETVASQMKWINNTREESKRMAELVADLLFLAKNDDGLKVQMETVNISDCVETAALSYDAVFYENGKDFRYEICKNIKVYGNEGQLKQLVTILLDNANKYSTGSGDIELSLVQSGKHVILTVSNNSDELTDENIQHLFDRFYTVDKSRNSDKGGNGLGLSIAQTICQTHGGDIAVEYNNGRIVFTVDMPVYKQKKD